MQLIRYWPQWGTHFISGVFAIPRDRYEPEIKLTAGTRGFAFITKLLEQGGARFSKINANGEVVLEIQGELERQLLLLLKVCPRLIHELARWVCGENMSEKRILSALERHIPRGGYIICDSCKDGRKAMAVLEDFVRVAKAFGKSDAEMMERLKAALNVRTLVLATIPRQG